jgi:hypothetical protein
MDSLYASGSFSPPFTYFGTAYDVWTVNSNGFITPGSHTDIGTANKLKPSTTAPVGTIAPFWDDLAQNNMAGANAFYQRMPAARGRLAHWVVQWSHFRYWTSSPVDDLNFQIKLFDDGVIEFHYATMFSGTTSNYGAGLSATTWLENPAGTLALPIGISTSYLTSNVAWRYTPTTPVTP